MYQVLYEKRVYKDLDQIPNHDVERIVRIFNGLSQDPLPPASKKLQSAPGLYRIRQGNYRIVYGVDHKVKQVKIIMVRHRKDIYRGI